MTVLGRRKTLESFLQSSWNGHEQFDGLDAVIMAIASGSYEVHKLVQAAALANALGSTEKTNIHNEIVAHLDTTSSDIFVEALSQSNRVAIVGCEEIERPVIFRDDILNTYMVLMDPLDGSSNIDVAISIGSIFGIWKRPKDDLLKEDSLLQPGNKQIAAAYTIYGSSTLLVVATQDRVDGFTLDSESGTFILTHENIKIPTECRYYSINEGNSKALDEGAQKAIESLRNNYSLRYVGSLVADFHRNLLKGGIFLYPGDQKHPDGKLRLMYEANPLGFVAEQAGGSASNGTDQILEIIPTDLHQRTPLILGNKSVVDQTVSIMDST